MGFSQQQSVQNHVLQLESIFTPTAEMLDLSKFTNVNQTITLTNTTFVLNVQFHGVLNSNGTSPWPLEETQVFNILSRLNEVYNIHNIFFKYRGFNTVNNSSLNNSNFSSFPLMASAIKQQFINENKYDDNSINFFLFQGSSGYISGVNPNNNTDVFLINLPPFTGGGYQYPHEIPKLLGYALGLLNIDTNSAVTSPTQVILNCFLTGAFNAENKLIKPIYNGFNSSVENVARSGANYNATTAGDLVADTAACFVGFQQNFCENSTGGYANLNSWNMSSTVLDQVGTPYLCAANEGNNFMGKYNGPGTNGLFTNGQVQRMKEYIEGNMDNIFRKKLNIFEDDSPDVSVLYEPFVVNGGGNNGNGNSTTAYSKTYAVNTTNTGANVWNCGPFTLRFQTGFNCEFTNIINGTIGTPFPKTIYEQYNSTNVNCLKLKIPILSPDDVYDICEPVCFSTFEPFTSGEIKSLNNLGIGIYTQEELDKIKASDPLLYQQLQSGMYHIITKKTDSGFSDQKVIYKN